MDVALYTGNGTSQSITGLGFSPDFVWIKNREVARDHRLFDVVRGATQSLQSSLTAAEATESTSLTAFTSDGFSLGSLTAVNESTKALVAWAWDAGTGSPVSNTDGSITSNVRANASAGFSIVTATASSAGDTIGHGLNAPLGLIIAKRTNTTSHWPVYHSSVGANGFVYLNLTNAAGTGSDFWNNVTPTSSVFTVGSDSAVSGGSAVFYCFAPVEGYSAFGSYTGNGSSDGPFVYTGFRPAVIIQKRTDSAGSWTIVDTARDIDNPAALELLPNSSAAEYDNTSLFDILSNGFKVRATFNNLNASSGSFIYIAFAEHPLKYSRAR